MFDILVGTIIPAQSAASMIEQLNPHGFECYELNFPSEFPENIIEYAKKINDIRKNAKISALSYYDNTMGKPEAYEKVKFLIENAHLFNCNRVCIFAGADSDKSIPDNMPLFKKTFQPLAELGEAFGVKIGFENCSSGWNGKGNNIAFGPDAWELMFNEVTSDALGLEWEPAHQVVSLVDPIAQLRKWAKKVVHVHGKDATVAWDIIREHGIRGKERFAWDRTPGFGDTNWADVFTILLQNGFEGAVDIEGYHDPVHYDDMEWTSQLTALDYLKRCRGGMDYFPGPTEYRGFQGKRKV